MASIPQFPVNALQQRLMNLRINNGARASDDRVGELHQPGRPRNNRREVHRLLPKERDRAIAIFNTLQAMGFERAPRLLPQESNSAARGEVMFEHSVIPFQWLDRRRVGPMGRGLTVVAGDLASLRRDIIHDLDRLHAQRLPYGPDLSRLLVVSERPGCLQPYISAQDFNLDIDLDDPTTPWAAIKQIRKLIIEAQLDAFEFLVALGRPTGTRPEPPSIRPNPSIASRVLRAVRQIIHHITRYSNELGKFLNRLSEALVFPYPARRESARLWTRKKINDYLLVVNYAICMITRSILHRDMPIGMLMIDRAALLIVRTVMLIRLHAKVLPLNRPLCLFFRSSGDTAESYTTHQGYVSVTESHREMESAVRQLPMIGVTMLQAYARSATVAAAFDAVVWMDREVEAH
ncbi:hypothetical protein F4801DRAFT_544106 [Xylaria longipes]|nr:hypothetical protein F4801DRAFT_544106 [Xylaria longipes]